MSGRGATGAFLFGVAGQRVNTVHLLQIDFGDVVYLTDAAVGVTWDGQTYLPSPFLGFSPISETSELLVNTCTISLSGADPNVVVLLLRETYLNRKVKVWRAILDETLRLLPSPLLIFDGRLDNPTIVVDPDNGTVVCSVDGISHWTDFERRAGRHSNDSEQKKLFPGDKGFAQVAVLPKQIFWGGLKIVDASKRGGYLRG